MSLELSKKSKTISMLKASMMVVSLAFASIGSAGQLGEQDLGHPEVISRQFSISLSECLYSFKAHGENNFECKLIVPQAEYGTVYNPNTVTEVIAQSGRCYIYFVTTQDGVGMALSASRQSVTSVALSETEAKACLATVFAKEKIADKIFNINIMVLRK